MDPVSSPAQINVFFSHWRKLQGDAIKRLADFNSGILATLGRGVFGNASECLLFPTDLPA